MNPLGREGSVTVQGATIRYLSIGDHHLPPLLFVHGGGANRSWWFGMLDEFSLDRRVIVVDLSGHGDSDHRRSGYSPEVWADELVAVLGAEEVSTTDVVGHSMGGYVATYLCSLWPKRVDRAVLIDSGVRRPGPTGQAPRGRDRKESNRIYPSRDEALARFRLVPTQPTVNEEMQAVIAGHSVRETNGGWTWKFDPQVFKRFTDIGLHGAVRSMACPVGLIYGEHSRSCGPETLDYLREVVGPQVPSRMIYGAHHHVPIDAPEACAEAVRWMLDEALR